MDRQSPRIHLVPHFHYDPVWIEDQRTYTNRAFDLIERYLTACEKDEGYHLLLSELDYLRPFLAARTDHRQLVNALIAAGRIATGGSYSQPNEMTIQGEPLIRNLLYGRLYHEGALGTTPTAYLPLDVFGHCLQLPQIAAKAGFQAVIWSKPIAGTPPIALALAPDGTTILQKCEPYWYFPETVEQFLDTVVNGLEHQAALGLNTDLRFLGHDMAEPRDWLAGRCQQLTQREPAVEVSTPDKYVAAITAELRLRQGALPITARDAAWYHLGTAVTRADLKIANRLTENRVLDAEKWATFAGLLGAIYPDAALDKAWRQLLFGQHHDAITGVSSDIPYLDLLASYRESLDVAVTVEENAHRYIADRIDTAAGRRAPRDGTALVVFNPMNWERTDICRTRIKLEGVLASGFKVIAEGGREAPCQILARSERKQWAEIAFLAQGVPSLGYQTYYVAPASSLPEEPSFSDSSDGKIENDLLSITVAPARGGGITSLFSKSLKREFANPEVGPANELVVVSEDAGREDAPWELFTTGQVLRSRDLPARVQIMKGPVFSQLRITAQLPDRGTLIQEITLCRDISRVDLRTTIADYRGEHELLALTFPLDLPGAVPTFEDRFATILRRPSAGKLDFRTLREQNISDCGLGAAQNWVDVGRAPSLDIVSGRRPVASVPLGPCVLVTSSDPKERSAARILQEALVRHGVPCGHSLDSNALEDVVGSAFVISLGRRNAYSTDLVEHFPDAAPRLAEGHGKEAWTGVLLHQPDARRAGQSVPVLLIDTNGNGDTLETARAFAAALDEGKVQLPESRNFADLPKPAAEAGVAVINQGSLAASLEQDGTLVAPLFHTSAWSTHAWGEGRLERFFVPEHRSQVFEHSLYPHAGDWRQGGVVRAGYEVNHPLRAMQAHVSPGVLPTSHSLLSSEAANLVVVAMKPVGNPLAEHKIAERSDPQRGILIRAYESAGKPLQAGLRFMESPESAYLADLLEAKTTELEVTRGGLLRASALEVNLPPRDVASIVVKLPALAEAGPPKQLGPTAEPYSPIHARWWDHNLGAASLGNQLATIWTHGPLPVGETTRFPLGITNDARDKEIAGAVQMIAPEHWTMIPRQLPYRVQPNSPALYEVMVVVPEDAQPCFVRAVIEEGKQKLQDVIPVGDIRPLEISLTRETEGFSVRINNPNPDYVEGHVSLITPVETWGPLVDNHRRATITPRLAPFRIEANSAQEFRFDAVGVVEDQWAVAKVAWYGNVQYVQEAGED
ncbi:MAG: hypothetical protein JXA57_18275 [Armatimonadetes bacterium]|nr:hypothetical protein [Armatimonadota bacterium]